MALTFMMWYNFSLGVSSLCQTSGIESIWTGHNNMEQHSIRSIKWFIVGVYLVSWNLIYNFNKFSSTLTTFSLTSGVSYPGICSSTSLGSVTPIFLVNRTNKVGKSQVANRHVFHCNILYQLICRTQNVHKYLMTVM